MKDDIKSIVISFYLQSSDCNGIPLRDISTQLETDYKESIDYVKELVSDGILTIQSSTNPHIKGRFEYPIADQLKILDDAKESQLREIDFLNTSNDIDSVFPPFKFVSESMEYPVCVYPSSGYLEESYSHVVESDIPVYSNELKLGKPQLEPVFFKIEVLNRYSNDPRFEFKFENYSGSLYAFTDENGNSKLINSDQIFLKTFGIGFDNSGNRLLVVYRRYLGDLSPEHQIYWKSYEVENGKVLEEYHVNTVLGAFTSSYSVFTGIVGEISAINKLCNSAFGEKLFKSEFSDEDRPRDFTFYSLPTLKNYESFVLLMDKMLSDNINRKFFKDKIALTKEVELKKGKLSTINIGTLGLLENWLRKYFNPVDSNAISEFIQPLKAVRKARQAPAHKINDNIYNTEYHKMQMDIVKEVYQCLMSLRVAISSHPKANEDDVPRWLKEGNIKSF